MNNERYNQIIDEVYEKYKKYIETQQDIQKKEVQRLRSQGKRVRVVKIILLTKEEFITKCKTDLEFSERWGLKIEERELSSSERVKMYEQKTNVDTSFFPILTETLTFHKIPTKLITLTYKDETIEVYE